MRDLVTFYSRDLTSNHVTSNSKNTAKLMLCTVYTQTALQSATTLKQYITTHNTTERRRRRRQKRKVIKAPGR